MLCQEVLNYISATKGAPFFYLVGDEEYNTVLNDFKQSGITVVHISDFCPKEDKFPSIENLINFFYTSDIDYKSNKFVLVGLGEYLMMRGAEYTANEFRHLKDTSLGDARVIFLIRGVTAQMQALVKEDRRLSQKQRVFISNNIDTNISITNIPEDIGTLAQKGVKHLLYTLEDGASGNIYASSKLSFEDSIVPVKTLLGAYSVIKLMVEGFCVSPDIGTEEQWTRLLKEFSKCNKSLSSVFEKYGIDDNLLDDCYQNISGIEYENWLAFLYLKLNITHIKNNYLQLVVSEVKSCTELKKSLLVRITEISHNETDFMKLYNSRKILLKSFSEADIAVFVKANEVDPEESIYKFTDNTLLEKKAIIKWINTNGLSKAIDYVYPALSAYLKKYVFDCPAAEALTEYFEEYKRQKITNRISDEFINLLRAHATDFLYTKLDTRDNAVKAIEDKNNTYLYWIDALGVEYMSYISELAKQKGLSIHTDIARSDLPTITSVNKLFYDQWPDGKKYKEEQLDNIKHKEKGGYFFTEEDAPIHIPAELEVIERAVNTAAMELAMHNCKSFVIASDHGASRLAVIKCQEIPYETDTKGEHSGRCCKTFAGWDVPFGIEDNGYIMLADYGRFKGSRTANVEVHGGASLEEIIVPVITLTLKKSTGVKIQLIHPEDIKLDRQKGVILTIYISDVDCVDNISLVIDEKRYIGKKIDETHFLFELTDIKRIKSKPYNANVFDGEDLIGSVSFKVKGKTAMVNDDFDDLF